MAELGEVETPVVLTNTLAVGAAHEGVVRSLLARDPDLGRPRTVNPVVLECNDGRLDDLRALAVRPEHVVEAIRLAEESPDGRAVQQGAVGAGHGMVAFGWKGGIGTASTAVVDGAWQGTLGCLVLTNMGRPEDLVVHGRRVGAMQSTTRSGSDASSDDPARRTRPGVSATPADGAGQPDGSVIVLLATDAPFDSRQLGRLARRAQNGLARTGVVTDHGSGEFVLAWSTAAPQLRRDGDWLRPWFAAVADVVEEAVLSSMWHARTVTGRDGLTVERCPAL